MNATVKLRRLHPGDPRPLPAYKTPGAAGMDIPCLSAFTIPPGAIMRVPTGFQVEISEGFEGQVRPRSGLALEGISVVNTPGTIDCDFRGEICVILENRGTRAKPFSAGDRIAQLVISPVARAVIEEATDLSETERGEGGFGSTGIR